MCVSLVGGNYNSSDNLRESRALTSNFQSRFIYISHFVFVDNLFYIFVKREMNAFMSL